MYDNEQIADISIVVWSLWTSRNKVCFNEAPQDPVRGMLNSLALRKDFITTKDMESKVGEKRLPGDGTQWIKPRRGMVKICDASVCGNGFVGLGCVIRDSNGQVIGAAVDRVNGNMGVEPAECLAIRMALKHGRDLGVVDCIVESDCLVVVSKLLSSNENQDMIIDDCRDLSRCFNYVEFAFYKEDGK